MMMFSCHFKDNDDWSKGVTWNWIRQPAHQTTATLQQEISACFGTAKSLEMDQNIEFEILKRHQANHKWCLQVPFTMLSHFLKMSKTACIPIDTKEEEVPRPVSPNWIWQLSFSSTLHCQRTESLRGWQWDPSRTPERFSWQDWSLLSQWFTAFIWLPHPVTGIAVFSLTEKRGRELQRANKAQCACGLGTKPSSESQS